MKNRKKDNAIWILLLIYGLILTGLILAVCLKKDNKADVVSKPAAIILYSPLNTIQ